MRFSLERDSLTYKEQKDQKYVQRQKGMRRVLLLKMALLPDNTLGEQFASMVYVFPKYVRIVIRFRLPGIGINEISHLKDCKD